jgi:hypothetical protein
MAVSMPSPLLQQRHVRLAKRTVKFITHGRRRHPLRVLRP